jgi:hypothetical protein
VGAGSDGGYLAARHQGPELRQRSGCGTGWGEVEESHEEDASTGTAADRNRQACFADIMLDMTIFHGFAETHGARERILTLSERRTLALRVHRRSHSFSIRAIGAVLAANDVGLNRRSARVIVEDIRFTYWISIGASTTSTSRRAILSWDTGEVEVRAETQART